MHHIVYDVNSYVVEIEDKKGFGSGGLISTTWNWEITIAVHELSYKGKAIETRKGASIDWVELTEGDVLNEMIGHCKRYVNQNP